MKELKMKYWNEHSGGDIILLEIIRTKVASLLAAVRNITRWVFFPGNIHNSGTDWNDEL